MNKNGCINFNLERSRKIVVCNSASIENENNFLIESFSNVAFCLNLKNKSKSSKEEETPRAQLKTASEDNNFSHQGNVRTKFSMWSFTQIYTFTQKARWKLTILVAFYFTKRWRRKNLNSQFLLSHSFIKKNSTKKMVLCCFFVRKFLLPARNFSNIFCQ